MQEIVKTKNLYIVLDNIRSAWNVGSIMRTCDAVGASLILTGYTPLPTGLSLKLITKTSIGAEKTVPWQNFTNFQEVFATYPNQKPTFLSTQNLHLAIDITSKSKNLFDYLQTSKIDNNLNQNIFLWFGNEIHGIQKQILDQCDHTLHLPMQGLKESLNVANATTACAYLFLYFQQMC